MNIVKGNDEALHTFYERHNGRLGVEFDRLANAISDWNVWVVCDDEPIAVVVEKNGSAHVSAYGMSRIGISKLKQAMDLLNVTQTTVSEEFKAGHALAKRLGFYEDHKEGTVTHYVRISH